MGRDQLLEEKLLALGMPMTAPLHIEDMQIAAELDNIAQPPYKDTEDFVQRTLAGEYRKSSYFQTEAELGDSPQVVRQSLVKNGFGVEYRLGKDGSENICVEFSPNYAGAEGFDTEFYNYNNAYFMFTMYLKDGTASWDDLLENQDEFNLTTNGALGWNEYRDDLQRIKTISTPQEAVVAIAEFLGKRQNL